MSRLRLRSAAQGVQAPKAAKPPRLVLRFGLVTAIGLAIAAAGILVFVRHHGITQGESAVAFHARFVADSILRGQLRPSDFSAPVNEARRGELDRLFRRQVLVGGALRARLLSPDGRVTYSTDSSLIGKNAPDAVRVEEALTGTTVTGVETVYRGDGEGAKALAAYLPIRFSGSPPAGVFELSQDYAPIARSARKAFLPVAAVLQFVLIALYASLFPLLHGVTKTLRRQDAGDRASGDPRRLERAPEPILLPRAGRGRSPRRKERRVGADRHAHRPRPLQGDQRHARAPERRPSPPGARSPPAPPLPVKRHRGAPGRGRVRRPLARYRRSDQRPSARGASAPGDRNALRHRQPHPHGRGERRHRALSGARRDVETLIRHADVAMYTSKQTHAPRIYASEHDHHSHDRLSLVGELRRAIENRELVLHYQPCVDFESGELRGVEALVRWQHPDRGLVLPTDFIPVAEETGLIRPLSRYVLDTALRECGAWREQGLDLNVAVNLSGRDVLDLGLPDEVHGLLARWEVDPNCLELETTENAILADPARAQAVLTRLSERGVRIAIDDFGSRHSSLRYLKRLPIDVIKIDRSFVLNMATDESDRAIVRSTIDLGHSLGLTVVAEGVESEEVWDRLASLGCDAAQGFYLSRPLSASALTKWLLSRRDKAKPSRKAKRKIGEVVPLA